jgi:ankyrin repeat protein
MTARTFFRKMRTPGLCSSILITLVCAAAPAFLDAAPSHEQQVARAALEKNRWEFSEDRFVTLATTAKRDVIELYLKAGMSPNARDARGKPAIVAVLAGGKLFSGNDLGSMEHALLKERFDVLKYLLEAGADPSAANKDGITALHEAAVYPAFAPAIKMLVKAGAQVDVPEAKYHFSPLHLAALKGNVEGVRELLAQGARPDSLANQSFTPLMLALNAGNQAIADLLLKDGADPLKQTDGGKSCLHFAAESAPADSIKQLLARGASLTAVDGSGKTPLQMAQEKNRDQAILGLLQP